MAEVGGEDHDREMKLFTAGGRRLDSAYGFNFLYADRLTPALVADALRAWPDADGVGWPSWAFENHDAPRAVSRWTTADHADDFARMKALLLVCLRGNIFLYQGEELGLPQVDIAFEDLQDPEAIANWPRTLSRDGARTPMPWAGDAAQLGFSDGQPWLPIGTEHRALAVDRQEKDPGSLLHHMRHMLALRHSYRALAHGAIAIRTTTATTLAFVRGEGGDALMCVFNISDQPQHWQDDGADDWTIVAAVNGATLTELPPYGAYLAQRALGEG